MKRLVFPRCLATGFKNYSIVKQLENIELQTLYYTTLKCLLSTYYYSHSRCLRGILHFQNILNQSSWIIENGSRTDKLFKINLQGKDRILMRRIVGTMSAYPLVQVFCMQKILFNTSRQCKNSSIHPWWVQNNLHCESSPVARGLKQTMWSLHRFHAKYLH